MKVIIVGGGLCGLYIAYLLKNINIDFEIHEKSSRPGGRLKTINAFNTKLECGSHIIQPYHFNMISLLNKLKLKSSIMEGTKIFTIIDEINQEIFNELLNKIKASYDRDQPKNISAIIYFSVILSRIELNIFRSHIFMEQDLNSEISDYMKYTFYDLKLHNQDVCPTISTKRTSSNRTKHFLSQTNCSKNKYIKVNGGMQLITDKLAYLVQEKLYLNSPVTEITYLPITNSYMILANGRLINAERIVLATDASIKTIRLSIPKEIKQSIYNINSVPIMRLYTYHTESINLSVDSLGEMIQTQNILTNITQIAPKILGALYISGSKTDILYNLLTNSTNSANSANKDEIKKLIHTLLQNITGQRLPKVVDYVFCKWNYGSHYSSRQIKTNFWHKHNLILAGEWVHPYHNTLEGSVMSAIETFKIITQNLFEDKLKHKPDNVKSIEDNRRKYIPYNVLI
jgi:protoporphyrinogen oxidase